MNKEQKKLQKRKDREKIKSKKILLKRQALRTVAKKEKEEFLTEKRLKRLQRNIGKYDQAYSLEVYKNLSPETIAQLERNVEILRELEIEYAEHQLRRQKLNKELEEEGYLTLEGKLQAAKNKLIDHQKSFADESLPGETAEISITKAF